MNGILATSKFFVVAAIAFTMIFGATFAVSATKAQAVTLAELVELFISLGIIPADKAAAARAALATTGGTTGGSTSGSGCTTFTFTRNHSMGNSGGEVMEIQKFLNASADTQVAASGAGSPGMETSYFGPATRAAVIKFQNKYASEVLAPVGLTSGTGYWGASSRAKANALNAGCTGTPTTPGTAGTVSVSAVAQPANSLAPSGAARVPFTKFMLTNNSASTVTVSGVTVERTGLANNAAFSGVVLLDDSMGGAQLGIARILNSNNQAVIGDTITLNPGQSKTFTVAANIGTVGTTYAGQVAAFAVVGVNTSATVSGTLPISGAQHTLNGSLSIGTATVDRGSSYPATDGIDQNIGTTDYAFSSVRVTAGSAEDVRVSSIRWNQSGSASAGDLANIEVVVDGVTYPTTVSSDGKYYTATFGSGIVIAKGFSKEFTLRGDIMSGAGRSVSFDVYRLTDIAVTGQTFGYGITPTGTGQFSNSATPAYNENNVDITGGTLQSIARSNTVATGNVAEAVPNTSLGAFSINFSGEPVQVQSVDFDITLSTSTGGGTPTVGDITNVTLVNQDGAVLAGPVDGVATAATTGTVTFSGVTFPAGTSIITLKGTVGTDFVAGNTITVAVDISGWTGATGQNTGNGVTLTGTATANTQTVQSAALSATTLAIPAAASVVAGAQDFIWMTGALSATNSGEDIRVTSISIADAATSTQETDIDNVELWADLNSSNSARGDKYETQVSNTIQLADGTNAIALSNPILVARNATVEFAVIADLSASAVVAETHQIDIAAVTAVGASTGNTVAVSPSGAGQVMTVATGGGVTITVDSSSPAAKLILDNTTTEQTLAVFRLAASNVEGFDLDSITITEDGDDQAVARYSIYNGAAKLGENVNTGDGTTVYFSNGTVTIPQNGYVLLTVKGVMNDIDGSAVANGADVQPTIAAAGDVDVTGLGSGSTPTPTLTSGDPAVHEVYEAYPTFAFQSSSGTTLFPSSNMLVGRLTISNPGNKDVTFENGDSNQIILNFNIAGLLSGTSNMVTVKDDDSGITLDTANITATTGTATSTIDFSSSSLTIPAGGSKTVSISVNTTGLTTAGNSIQVWLDDAYDDAVVFGINGTGTYDEGQKVFRGDIYGPAYLKP